MIPYLHIWRITLPSFGLMLALAALAAGYVLHLNFRRYRIDADAITIISMATIAGVLGAKLWHVLEDPALLLAHPAVLLDRSGLAWFGGLVASIAALLLQARPNGLRALSILDLCAPSAALGYAIGRIGCFTSGDGDYGLPSNLPWAMSFPHGTDPTTVRVQPTPLYEWFVGCLIAWFLWKRSAPLRGRLLHAGQVTAEYLVLTGIARFLVEFIRRNPRIYWGMTNAQVASLGSIAAGALLYAYARRYSVASLLLPPKTAAASTPMVER